MANRRPTQVPLPDGRDPQGAVMGALPGVQRPTGEQFGVLAAVADRLSSQVGRIGDQLAGAEGRRDGQAAGADPNWRPSGDMTIKGRAYDEAAGDVYRSALDARFRSDALDVFEANKDDPAGYRAAFDGLVARYQRDHVFPEIAGHFDAAARNIDSSLRFKALENFEARQRDAALASLVRDREQSRENFGRQVQIAPNAPETDREADRYVAEQSGRIDGLVKNRAMSETEGEAEKRKIRADAKMTLILARGEQYGTPDGIRQYRAQLREQAIGGKLPGIDIDRVDAALERRERQLVHSNDVAFKAVETEAADMLGRAKDGMMPLPAELAEFRARANQTPEGKLVAEKFGWRLRMTELALTRGPETLTRVRAEMGKDPSTGMQPADAADLQWLEKLQDDLLRKRQADPVHYLEITGQTRPGTIPTAAKPADLVGEFRTRVMQIAGARMQFPNYPETYLKPDEVRGLGERFSRGGADAADLAAAIVAGAGPAAPRILKEIGREAPDFAHAASVSLATGDDRFARQVAQSLAARAVPGSRPPSADGRVLEKAASDTFGYALNGVDPAERERTKATAALWAETEFARRGIDPAARQNALVTGQILAEGLQRARGRRGSDKDALGGIADYVYAPGWFSDSTAKVQVPSDVKAARFGDVIRAITDQDIGRLPDPPVRSDGATVSAADLRRLIPIAGPGGYRFADRDPSDGSVRPIKAKSGAPFLLAWDSLAPELRKRVPDAFEGAP